MVDLTPVYEQSYTLPKYNIGQVTGIKCNEDKCSVRSAFNHGSGCDTEFNPTTNTFGIPVCEQEAQNGGTTTFTPKGFN